MVLVRAVTLPDHRPRRPPCYKLPPYSFIPCPVDLWAHSVCYAKSIGGENEERVLGEEAASASRGFMQHSGKSRGDSLCLNPMNPCMSETFHKKGSRLAALGAWLPRRVAPSVSTPLPPTSRAPRKEVEELLEGLELVGVVEKVDGAGWGRI